MKTALIFLAAMTAALALANGYLIYAKYDLERVLVQRDMELALDVVAMRHAMIWIKHASVQCGQSI